MKYGTWATLIGMGLFGCASTDKAAPSTKDAGTQNQGGSGGKGIETVCDESACEGHRIAGQPLATCCFSERGCGVIIDGTCTAPIVLAAREREGGAPSPFGTAETVMLDPSCPDSVFSMGATITLKGCCDKSGICGGSTEGFSANLGIAIPAMCITPTEAQRFGRMPPEAGAEKACRYPSDAGSPADSSTRD